MFDRDKKIIKWFISGDSGVSSQTLCARLYGIPLKRNQDNYPHDSGDFGRCKRFLKLLCPEDKNTLLRAMVKVSPQWKALVEKWHYLERINSNEILYAEMRKILQEAHND